MNLPCLREDLSIHPAPRLADGQPCWSIQDPARNRFFRIDWQTFEIIVRWTLDDADKISQSINSETALRIDPQDVITVEEFLSDNQLTIPYGDNMSQIFAGKEQAEKAYGLIWMLKHYLFFRVPLVRPDCFLSATVHWVSSLFNRTFMRLTLAVFIIAFVLVYRDFERFTQSWVDMFNFHGVLAYAVAIILVKVIHELGHAYTAKLYGCRIPTMGVAFLVMWPVAYTDTNDIWTLAERDKRLKVVAAGVVTELAIAVWATLLWALLPPGALRDVAFLLSTTTWITTLLINASPFMRFDGYFFLSDLLDMPNLHQRAFALARWRLREMLFGLGAAPPEYFSRAKTNGLILFAFMTWAYRLVVFFGIALLVYKFFFKAVGVILFAVEIYWFILMPVVVELLEWYKLLPVIRQRRKGYWSAAIGGGLLMVMAVPWPTGVTAPATLQSAKIFPIYAPIDAHLTSMPWREGDEVPQDQLLFSMSSPELELRKQQAVTLLRQRQWAMESSSVSSGQRQEYQVLEQALLLARSILQDTEADDRRNSPRATFSGRLRDVNHDLRVGGWVRSGEKLGSLVKDGSCKVEAYIGEEDLGRVHSGDTAMFYADGAVGEYIRLTLTQIDADASRVLAQDMLTSQSGGSIKAREVRGGFVPDTAVYRALFSCKDNPQKLSNHMWRGSVVIRGDWQSPLKRYLESIYSLLLREGGMG